MKFCPECENALIPKDNKLYCQVCDKHFEIQEDLDDEYISHREGTDIKTDPKTHVVKNEAEREVTEREREAKEDYFGIAE